MAVTQGAAAGKHTWWRGHFLRGEKVVVGHWVLERVAVIVCVAVAVSVDWQRVCGLVAAEALGGRWRSGLAEWQ